MATKKGADDENDRPPAKAAKPRPASRGRATANTSSTSKKASGAARSGGGGTRTSAASSDARPKPKRLASPRIRASHAGVAEPGRGAPRPRASADGDTAERRARPIPADRPTRPRRPTREGADAPPPPREARSRDSRPSGSTLGKPALGPRTPGRNKTPLAGPKRTGPRRSAPPAVPQPSAHARDLALALAAAGLDKKAIGVEILEVIGRVDYADYLVVMTGRSDRHVHAIATGLEEATRKDKLAPLSMEGLSAATWVLIDYGDVVVHVFQEEARRLYDIEGLWIDAGRIPVPDDEGPGVHAPARPEPS